jgi:transposase InsO family protein
VKFAFIDQHRRRWPVRVTCRVLRVSPGGFYKWTKRKPSARQRRQQELLAKIRIAHRQNQELYGSPRVHRALLIDGEHVSRNTVAKLMRQADIRAKRPKRFVPRTTDSNHHQPLAANQLDRDFTAAAPNQKWLADITYVPTNQGWLYLAAVLDCFSRKIVGWSMSDRLETDLAADALEMALLQRDVVSGGAGAGGALIHHSDRGVQYASDAYQQILSRHGIAVSMSGRGNCYDNAMMESFFATLKTECVHGQMFATREQARSAIFQYIEVFYNRRRLHSSIGYVSPESFEAVA